MMPEWLLIVAILGVVSAFGLLWKPLLLAVPVLLLAVAAVVAQAILSAAHADFSDRSRTLVPLAGLRGLTAMLHLIQPVARLWGRLHHGLTPWRRRGTPHFAFPRPRTTAVWSERWQAPEKRLASMEAILRAQGTVVASGGGYDRWDLEIRGGLFGVVRMRMAIEEHGAGRQQVLFRSWPRFSPTGFALTLMFLGLSFLALIDGAWAAGALFGAFSTLLTTRTFGDCAAATASYLYALRQPGIGWR